MTKEPISLRDSLDKAVALHDAAVAAGVTDPRDLDRLVRIGRIAVEAARAQTVRKDPFGAAGARFEKVCDKDGAHVITHDLASGLEWDVTDFGGKRMTFDEAQKACAALRTGGHSDWRLPTIQELLGLVDYERHSPAIEKEFFPNTGTDYYYRTSTPYAPASGCAWGVHFRVGRSYGLYRDGGGFVRAVRASQF